MPLFKETSYLRRENSTLAAAPYNIEKSDTYAKRLPIECRLKDAQLGGKF